MELQGRLAEIRKAGLGVAAISYDPVSDAERFRRQRRGITFPLLSDSGSETIKRYGILNTTVDPEERVLRVSVPRHLHRRHTGVVTSRFFEEAYQERDTVSSILVRLGQHVGVPATKIDGAHVDVTSYATDEVAAQGTHFSLVLDVTTRTACSRLRPGRDATTSR